MEREGLVCVSSGLRDNFEKSPEDNKTSDVRPCSGRTVLGIREVLRWEGKIWCEGT